MEWSGLAGDGKELVDHGLVGVERRHQPVGAFVGSVGQPAIVAGSGWRISRRPPPKLKMILSRRSAIGNSPYFLRPGRGGISW
jgi:hypothetical protein